MKEKVATVYRTTDYGMFKNLEGNRDISMQRVSMVRESINAVGYVLNPIIVNERMEVIDGQCRLAVLKEMKKPVDYVVAEGAGFAECVQLNKALSKWRLTDYIKGYAERGNESYKWLKLLNDAYGKYFSIRVILCAIRSIQDVNTNAITDGKFTCTEAEYVGAVKMLEYLKEFLPIMDTVKGRKEYYMMAIIICHRIGKADGDMLISKMSAGKAGLLPVSSVKEAIGQIEAKYNYMNRKKIYFIAEYQKWLDETITWYRSRYMEKRDK